MLACPSEFSEPLKALARRVGQNREIAGVHYPSDREASERIAPKVLDKLMNGKPQPKVGPSPLFREIVKEARREWSMSGEPCWANPLDDSAAMQSAAVSASEVDHD